MIMVCFPLSFYVCEERRGDIDMRIKVYRPYLPGGRLAYDHDNTNKNLHTHSNFLPCLLDHLKAK